MTKKILVLLFVLTLCETGVCQQMRTLGGLGAGGMNGQGFGDPYANDYANIDRLHNMETAAIVRGSGDIVASMLGGQSFFGESYVAPNLGAPGGMSLGYVPGQHLNRINEYFMGRELNWQWRKREYQRSRERW